MLGEDLQVLFSLKVQPGSPGEWVLLAGTSCCVKVMSPLEMSLVCYVCSALFLVGTGAGCRKNVQKAWKPVCIGCWVLKAAVPTPAALRQPLFARCWASLWLVRGRWTENTAEHGGVCILKNLPGFVVLEGD